jgi:hypothetical protein
MRRDSQFALILALALAANAMAGAPGKVQPDPAAPCPQSGTKQLFPKAKVFSMRFSCDDDVEENLTYTNVNDKFGFLAVYAGLTMKEAKARLAEVKATGKFAGANIRKMQAKRISP